MKKLIKGLTSGPKLEEVIIYEAHDDTVNECTMDMLGKIWEEGMDINLVVMNKNKARTAHKL